MQFTHYIDAPSPQATCANIAMAYQSVAYNESNAIADGHGVIYTSLQRALLAAIRQAYGMSALKARRVLDVMIDSGESVAWCADYVRTHRTSSAYER